MRKLAIMVVATAGLALGASGGTVAAPANGVAIDAVANATTSAQVVHYRHHRWHCPPRRCWRWKCHKVYRYM